MRLIFITIFLFASILLEAQDFSKIKFGKIDKADLEMLIYEQDSSAEAVVLNDLTNIWLKNALNQRNVVYDRHIRIKILKEEGFDRGDIELPFYTKERMEDMSQLKVTVHQPDGSKYELKKGEKIKEKLSTSWTAYKFSAPQLQEGSIIEYKYQLISKRVVFLEDWIFQKSIPVRYCRLEFDIPGSFQYATLTTNPTLVTSVKNIKTVQYVPAMKEESHITTMRDYRGRVSFQLKRYDNGSHVTDYYSTWPKLADKMITHESFGKQFTKRGNYKDLYKKLAHVIEDETMSQQAKIDHFYSYILENVKWDRTFRLYANKNLNDVFNKGEGNSSEMNMMMLAMLNEAGIKAYPVMLSPRHLGKTYPFHPFLEQFRHMMVLAQINGKDKYYDLSDKWREPGLPSTINLNGDVWLVDPANPRWLVLNPNFGEDIFLFSCKLDEEMNLNLNIKGKYKSYNSIGERKLHDKDSTGIHWKNRLSDKFPDAKVISAQCENLNDLHEDFKEEIVMKVPGVVQDAGSLLYIDPFLYSNFKENPFKMENRNYPVDYSYPMGEKYVFQLSIPEGYEVDELPESVSLKLSDGGASFKLISSSANNKIQILRQFKMKKHKFLPEEYDALKGIFDRMIEKSGEMIVLKKT